MNFDRYSAQREAEKLQAPVEEARKLAERLGLEPYPVNYWIVDYDEMNELIAYGGFQQRYPHWRWGMQYDRQQKQGQYMGGKAFEIVNNDNPSHAFLQESNELADQKAVITHVEAHADFFANNQWFGLFTDGRSNDTVEAAAMLERHARQIREYMEDPEIDRGDVERWIDHVLTLEDTIDQHQAFSATRPGDPESELEQREADLAEQLAELELSDEVREEVFSEEWLEGQADDEDTTDPTTPEKDVIAFLGEHGKQFDADAGKAREYEPWQRDVLEMLRTESYYFAGQKMTKIMNEGWASYWESVMMAGENFAEADEFLTYADHMARVLGSPGLNPYKLGLELWQYAENTVNRREVLDKLLRVEGISWRNLSESVDFDAVLETLEPPSALKLITGDRLDEVADLPDRYVDRENLQRARDGDIDVDRYPWKVLTYEGLARRHFSLIKPQNRSFLPSVSQSELERLGRYLFDDAIYDSVEEALEDVDYTTGWDRMREIRESHNDVTFLDEFLTDEFVEEGEYFTYEHSHATGQPRVASRDAADVKKKLLLRFTNFGKPTIVVSDGNYNNRNELLLSHRYNGVMLDIEQAKRTLERVFELWGRPVNLVTIVKRIDDHDREVARRRNEEPEPTEQGALIRYDGETFDERSLPWEDVEDIAASDIDYDTKPDDWLA
ncbi:SpoVR family protein [Natranaeroarchaeum sulfidigenes]|uniref:Putative membrane protein n=1 Tax=Natranaeroarchaeum sulfidigenes TaxID=2784880 RepID=A0A897MVB5_9EURY|nr:SpoVR family protein [Natranaeroarchaeum sulfidigenes]QSG02195.1 putative membrane protein [Natranaeroarchaeum sulfidigenes]